MAGKKKNRAVPLIAGVCVIAALAAVLLITQRAADTYEDEENETAMLTDVTADQITGFAITGADSSEIAFEKQDGEWVSVTDPDLEVDQTTVGATASSLTGITLEQTIQGVTDLAQYGLDDPEYEIAIEYTEIQADSEADSVARSGESSAASDPAAASEEDSTASDADAETKSVSIAVGSTNDTTSTVYCCLNGDTSTVYAVSTSITSNLSKTLEDYEVESDTSSVESAS